MIVNESTSRIPTVHHLRAKALTCWEIRSGRAATALPPACMNACQEPVACCHRQTRMPAVPRPAVFHHTTSPRALQHWYSTAAGSIATCTARPATHHHEQAAGLSGHEERHKEAVVAQPDAVAHHVAVLQGGSPAKHAQMPIDMGESIHGSQAVD